MAPGDRDDEIALDATVTPTVGEAPTLTPGPDPASTPTTRTLGPTGGPAAPAELERYELRGLLGAGGMGEVHAAEDRRVGREVAIKQMRALHSVEATERFLREARIQGRLEHPSIVPVHDLGLDERGRPYFVMKRLEGTTLRDLLGGGPGADRFGRRRLLEAMVDVCLAIELAHGKGVIHRDLKPSNIMLGAHGEVYVLDWGVARVVREADGAWREVASLDGSATMAGAILGTPGFMAPEQARGEAVDHRADVYALGATLFEVLAGEPFAPRGALDAGDAEVRPGRRRPDREVAPELDEACAWALARGRGARCPSARALADAIQAYLDGDRDLERRRTLAGEHLHAARVAIARSELPAAIRAAGRALALDPASAEAAGLVSRLMLEPPTELPAAVAAQLRRQDDDSVRREARRAIGTYAVFVAGFPLLLWQGVGRWWPLGLFYAVVAAAAVDSWLLSRARHVSSPRLWFCYALNIAMVGLMSTMVGPFLVVPAMAGTIAVVFGSFPQLRSAVAVGAVAALAVVVPWLLEATGLTWQSTVVADGALHVRSYALEVQPANLTALLLFNTIALLLIVAAIARNSAQSERLLRQELALRAWKLGQLVPDEPAAAAAAAPAGGGKP